MRIFFTTVFKGEPSGSWKTDIFSWRCTVGPLLFIFLYGICAEAKWQNFNFQIKPFVDTFISPTYEGTSARTYFYLEGDVLSDALLKESQNNSKDYFFPDPRTAEDGQFDLRVINCPQAWVLSNVDLRELYYTKFHFTIGRKIDLWNSLDDEWLLGEFQPRNLWNPLDPNVQGLTGIFYDLDFSNFRFTFFGSPFFIPEQGPGYVMRDGQFQQDNPYFSTPPTTVQIGTRTDLNPIDYDVEKPSAESVINNVVLAAKLEYDVTDDLHLRIAAQRKPSHQLLMGGKYYFSSSDHATVTLVPTFPEETLLGFDIAYEVPSYTIGISYLTSTEDAGTLDPTLSYTLRDRFDFLSPTFAARIEDLHFSISTLHFLRSDIRVIGPQNQDLASVLPQKFNVDDSFLFRLWHTVQLKSFHRLTTSARFQQAFRGDYALFLFQLDYLVAPAWTLEGHFLLVDGHGDRHLYSDLTDRDDLGVGLQYAF